MKDMEEKALKGVSRESAPPVRAGISVPVTCNRPTPPSRAGLKAPGADCGC